MARLLLPQVTQVTPYYDMFPVLIKKMKSIFFLYHLKNAVFYRFLAMPKLSTNPLPLFYWEVRGRAGVILLGGVGGRFLEAPPQKLGFFKNAPHSRF